KGKEQIVFTSIPYQINKSNLLEKMGELAREKKIEGIAEVRDESSMEGIRIVVELKREANPQITLNRLFKQTQLQASYSMILLALVDGQPRVLNLREILVHYLEHQQDIVTRRTRFDLKKAEARAHILEGLLIALMNIDEVIKTIRESYDNAKERLMERFRLSDLQAQAILEMQLRRLQGLEKEKLENEYAELKKMIAYYQDLLSDEAKIMGVVKTELIEIRDKWGDKRKTQIVAASAEIEDEDLIEESQVAITLTHLGYIKRIDADEYKIQHRGGKGIKALTTRENDFVRDLIITSTHDYLMFFTNTGKVHKIKAYEIPEAQRTAKGTPAINFLNLMQRERITALMPIREFPENRFLICVTKKGTIKKTPLSQYDTSRKNGLIAIALRDGDEMIGIKQSSGSDLVILVTKFGKSICFHEEDVRSMGRVAGGVRGIQLEDGDEVIAMDLVQPEEQLLVVTQFGYGKKTNVSEYTVQRRGGMGLLTYDKKKIVKTGELIGACTVEEGDEIMLINSDGILIRIGANDVSKLGRATQGVKIMKVGEEAQIIAMAKVAKEEDEV
ncbi:MAG: DNA gyrase subunit A, partial [Clostridiales bacterium]|nr:DNA gyrase subunit A [Clostridiales bacterium]